MYDKAKILKTAIAAAIENKLFFIDDIIAYVPCSRATFYEYQLDKSDALRTEINKNKISVKVSLRAKWYHSDNTTLQLALYRLCATVEELRALAMYHQIESKDPPVFELIMPDGKNKSKSNGSIPKEFKGNGKDRPK